MDDRDVIRTDFCSLYPYCVSLDVPVNNYYARAREDDYAPVAMGCPNTHESMEWM